VVSPATARLAAGVGAAAAATTAANALAATKAILELRNDWASVRTRPARPINLQAVEALRSSAVNGLA
jgi:hypothetical protein